MKFSLAQKFKALAASIVVFLLVLMTNRMDSKHFETMQRTLETIYQDRLVAKNYIYRLSSQVHQKRLILLGDDTDNMAAVIRQANDSINKLLVKFDRTVLTKKENKHFNSLKAHLQELATQESRALKQAEDGARIAEIVDAHYAEVNDDLDVLSEIQLVEGNRQLIVSAKAVETSNLMSRIEIGVLIFLGIIIQFIIFYKPSK